MIGVIRIKDYSIFAKRNEQRELRKNLKLGFEAAGRHFHDHMREKRFTTAHATRAGFAPRKSRYMSVKFKKFGHSRPLEFTGTTRRAISGWAKITATSKGAKVAYPGARVFNFRNPLSDPRMNLNNEFRTITGDEAEELAVIVGREVETMCYHWHMQNNNPEVLALLESAGLSY